MAVDDQATVYLWGKNHMQQAQMDPRYAEAIEKLIRSSTLKVVMTGLSGSLNLVLHTFGVLEQRLPDSLSLRSPIPIR